LLYVAISKKVARMSEQKDPKTILYIEDDLANRILVRRVMQAEGYRVLEAETGKLGIQMAQAEQLALILVDVNMPEMDGFQVTGVLRSFPALQQVPIIALTANVMKGDREKALAAGCSGYIPKPIDVDQLPVQLASFMKK